MVELEVVFDRVPVAAHVADRTVHRERVVRDYRPAMGLIPFLLGHQRRTGNDADRQPD
jgi:hypothetical protein